MTKMLTVLGLSGLLNWVSQLNSETVLEFGKDASESGFPFAYVETIDTGAKNFDFGAFAGNWVFWLIISAVLVLVLSKVLELFGKVALFVGIGLAAAVYFGIISL